MILFKKIQIIFILLSGIIINFESPAKLQPIAYHVPTNDKLLTLSEGKHKLYGNFIYQLPSFDKVIIQDGLHVDIKTGAPALSFIEPPATVANIDKPIKKHATVCINIKNATLYIKQYNHPRYYLLKKPYKFKLHEKKFFPIITLYAANLKTLIVEGMAHVTGSDFRADNLQLYAFNRATIALGGKLHINQIVQNSKNSIELYGLVGKKLEIVGNARGLIYLTGEVDEFIAALYSAAHLNARCLRVKHGIIFATKRAFAAIHVTNDLDAFANKNSKIFYYKKPKVINKIMEDKGKILMPETMH